MFDATLEFSDFEMSVFQEALTTGSTSPELHRHIFPAVAFLSEMMTERQRKWRGFDRWYRVMMDYAVFGSEENPIEVEE